MGALEAAVEIKLKDKGRIWFWMGLAGLFMSQLYVFRELLVVFALFVMAFAGIALLVAGFYLLPGCWEYAVARFTNMRRPLIDIASVRPHSQKAA